MLTETAIHHDQKNDTAEFITPFTAYRRYQEVGGLLSMRAWVDAQNSGVDFNILRNQFPPQSRDPFSQYIQLGGNINPDLFYQVNPYPFLIYQECNPQNLRYREYLRASLLSTTTQPVEPDALITSLEKKNIPPPDEIKTFYNQISRIAPTTPAVGSPNGIHLELEQIPDFQKLLDATRIVTALTSSEGYMHYAKEVSNALELRPALQPWNLTDIQLQIEAYLIKGSIEEAEYLRSTLHR